MDTAASIPFNAWEQAVFVALFIVLVVVLLGWMAKQQKNWQDFMFRQNEDWQVSIKELNDKWQLWLAEQNARECDSMQKVSNALDRLTEKLTDHDEKVDKRFLEAVNQINNRQARSRNTKN